MEFRKLTKDEIEIRPTDTKFKGSATLLCYQDARCAMNILDDTVGPFGWQKDFKDLKGVMYAGIGIRDPQTGDFIWKWDAGMESNVDAQKGEASDAFKRAAVNWGIGRELYTAPRIKIKCPDSYYYNDRLCMTFKVREIGYNESGDIDHLIIVDKFGNVVFNLKNENVNETTSTVRTKAPQEKKTSLSAKNHSVNECKNICYTLYNEYLATGAYDANSLGIYWKGKQDYVEKCGGWNGDWDKYCRDDFRKQVESGKVRMAA